MDFAVGANGAAETRCNLVIAQIDMGAALRTNRRGRGGTDFLFRFAIETLDDRPVVLGPETFQFSEDRRIVRNRLYWFLFGVKPPHLLGNRGREMRAALAAHRALGRGILHLLKAAVRTIHTEFSRARLCHWSRWTKGGGLDAGAKCRFHRRWLFIPDDLRFRRSGRGFQAAAGAGHLGLADEGAAFFDHEACRLQITLQRAPRLQFAAFSDGDVAAHFPIHRDRFCFDLALDVRVLADRQDTVGIDFTFDLAVNQELFLEFDRAFDLDVA